MIEGHPKTPDGPVMAIWRIGIAAYRRAAQLGFHHRDCTYVGTVAIMEAFPELSRVEAGHHMWNAHGWITGSERAKWFYAGRPKTRWIWPPTSEGVGDLRWVARTG